MPKMSGQDDMPHPSMFGIRSSSWLKYANFVTSLYAACIVQMSDAVCHLSYMLPNARCHPIDDHEA